MNQDEILTSDQKQPEVAIQHVEKEPNLADFTSTVVHDLQAPLRSLTMFTELLSKKYQAELDEQGQKYLKRIADSGLRMQVLIEGLLAYSSAGSSEQTWMSVDLNQTLIQVKSDLQSAIAEQAKITVSDLPQILINPREIHQLFQNLIENAIKFCESVPEISVTATLQDNEWLFAVADNGIGIAPEFQLQIFEVLQRLHPTDVYPGNGMGLAICQKIVKRYGGRIWVKSEVGTGSTFYFTLPTDMCPKSPTAKIVQLLITSNVN